MKLSKKARTITEYAVWTLCSLTLVILARFHLAPTSLTEVAGFISGALCVWLTVKENIWNWPIGIANSIFFFVLFWHARLYASVGLQVIYVILGFLGWYWWLHGGENKSKLTIQRISRIHAAILVLITIVATYAMTMYLRRVSDAAPFLDATTTVLSLVAQYMLTRKMKANWWVWITADLIFIGLYISQRLYLTAVLYVIFTLMCVVGVIAWKKSYDLHASEAPS